MAIGRTQCRQWSTVSVGARQVELGAGRLRTPAQPFDLIKVGRRLKHQVIRDDVIGLSAELAYRFFLALFPFVIFVASLGGTIARTLNIENPARQAIDALGAVVPSEASQTIQRELEQIINNSSTSLLSAGVIFALIFATGGTNAVIKAMNRAYGVPEGRPFWRRYILAGVLSIIGGAGVVAAFLLFIPVRLLAPQLAEQLGLGELGGPLVTAVAVLGSMAVLVVAVTVIFRVAPNIRLPLRSVLPGAVFFAVGWLLAAFVFGYYVGNFGNYANMYGAMAGVVIMLLFFYITSFVLLLAAELNGVLHELGAPEDVEQRRQVSKAEAEAGRRSHPC